MEDKQYRPLWVKIERDLLTNPEIESLEEIMMISIIRLYKEVKGECPYPNIFFAKLFKSSEAKVEAIISNLVEKGMLNVLVGDSDEIVRYLSIR